MFLSPDIKRVRLLWDTWNQYLCIATMVLTSVASISSNEFYRSAIYASDLFHGFVNSMTIILISEWQGSDDKTIPQTDDGSLVAEFVLLVVLAFADALDIWLVDWINLVTVYLLSIDKLHADVNLFLIIVLHWKKTLKFSQQSSCYGPHPSVCLLHLGDTVLLASEALD